MTASIELQKAVYTELAKSYGVYDSLPKGVAMPYIIIGEELYFKRDTKIETRSEHIIAIHCWSDKQSSVECMTMMEAVRGLNESLAVQGHKVEQVRLEGSTLIKEISESTMKRHGAILVAFTLSKN